MFAIEDLRPRFAVTFGLPARWVDRLLEATHGTAHEFSRWIVMSDDLASLGLLDRRWSGCTDLRLVGLPRVDDAVLRTALGILEAEHVDPARAVWLQPHCGLALELPFLQAISVENRSPEAVLRELHPR